MSFTPALQMKNTLYDSRWGVSKEFGYLQTCKKKLLDNFATSSIIFGGRSVTKGLVSEVLEECAVDGWDGYDAVPISIDSANMAYELSDALIDGIHQPEIVPESDGNLSFEWSLGKDMIFTVIIDNSDLIYSGIFGKVVKSGEGPFSDELVKEVNSILSKYFKKAF